VVGKQHDFYFIAVEKEPPYGVAVYKATEPLLRYGQVVYKNLLNTYKNCKASGSWHCYSAEVIDLDLPSYMYKK
jgi:exodeoxyribonuclease VIII